MNSYEVKTERNGRILRVSCRRVGTATWILLGMFTLPGTVR